jgi:hypothetical protein
MAPIICNTQDGFTTLDNFIFTRLDPVLVHAPVEIFHPLKHFLVNINCCFVDENLVCSLGLAA